MKLKQETPMMLFRYNNYQKKDFIMEHKQVIKENGFVWMLKSGKKSSVDKIKCVMENGGYILLKAPKSDGGTLYIAKCIEFSENNPEASYYPKYYRDILEESHYSYRETFSQWFKIKSIKKLDTEILKKFVLIKGKKSVDDLLSNCMTAVMFVENETEIEV